MELGNYGKYIPQLSHLALILTAVIDLNGRFFGGRQVMAGFYDHEDFKAYKLNERTEWSVCRTDD